MECLKIRKLTKGYLEDLLEDELYQQTRDHLFGCSGCQDYFASFACLSNDLKHYDALQHLPGIEDAVQKQFASRISQLKFLFFRIRRTAVQGLAVFLVGFVFYSIGSDWVVKGQRKPKEDAWLLAQRTPQAQIFPKPPEIIMLERTMRLLNRSPTRASKTASESSKSTEVIMPVLQWRPIHMDLSFPKSSQDSSEILRQLDNLGVRLEAHESLWVFQVKLGKLDEFLNLVDPYRVDPPQRMQMGALSRSDPEGLIFISLYLRGADRQGLHLHIKFHLDNTYQIRRELKARFSLIQDSEDFWVFETACRDLEEVMKFIHELPGGKIEWASPAPACREDALFFVSLAAR